MSTKIKVSLKKLPGNVFEMSLEGDLTIYNVRKMNDFIGKKIDESMSLFLDLGKMNRIDTAGYQLLAYWKFAADEKGKEFGVTGAGPDVEALLDLYCDDILLAGVNNG